MTVFNPRLTSIKLLTFLRLPQLTNLGPTYFFQRRLRCPLRQYPTDPEEPNDNNDLSLMPVPASYNDIGTQKDLRDYAGAVTYEREFFVPSSWENKKIWIRFDSVCYSANVSINGKLVASHSIGHLPFGAEVSTVINVGEKNVVSVVVDNTLTNFTIPQGNNMYDHLAIYVKSADKSYEDNKILNNLSMSVEKGIMYGLLGASGSGKTTLLNCILGRKSLDKGEVWTLGAKPGTDNSAVPGPKIGHMPQEMALIPDYTVEETIIFFGRIANMSKEAICTRFYQLSRLLELPPKNQYVKDCSGGQQRRVSLAAALVHEAELLILDEPTVGVDSILRDKIWTYLLDQVKCGISIILTTHYIEECRNANKVGLMRNGKLLAEHSPDVLMSMYNSDTLEQAFLKICLEQDQGFLNESKNIATVHQAELSRDAPSTSSSMQSFDIRDYTSSEDLVRQPTKRSIKINTFMGINTIRLRALLHKNWKQFTRNIFGLVIFGLLPVVQTLFFLYSIGGDIRDLNLGIINDEVPREGCQTYHRELTVLPNNETYTCEFRNLTCRFLEYLEDPMINIVNFNEINEATAGVHHGEIIGFLYLPTNFSEAFEQMVGDILSIDKSTFEYGIIQAYFDMSNKATGGSLKYKLLDLFLDFQDDVYKDCLWNKRLARPPLNEEYIYGKKDESFLIFMVPGLVLSFGFSFGMTMTSQIMLSERFEGVWDRCLAAGVTTLEITCAHLILQGSIAIFDAVSPIIISLFIYGIEYQGSVLDMIITTNLQITCGLVMGFWISIVSKNQTQAHYIVTGLVFPTGILCGLMWPIEGMPFALRIIAYTMPMTLPVLALRNIIKKGWSIWMPEVVLANLVPVAWMVIFVLLSLLHIRRLK